MGRAGHRDTLISHIGVPLVIALAFSIAGRSALSSIKLRERGGRAQERSQKPDRQGVQEPDRQGTQELEKSEPKPVDGVMCKNCGSPVVQLSSGAYRCTKENKFTSTIPIGPLESSTSEKVPEKPSILEKPTEPSGLPPMPPELQFSEHVSERLATGLRQVYGITEQQAVYITRTVKDNPQLAQNPNYLASPFNSPSS